MARKLFATFLYPVHAAALIAPLIAAPATAQSNSIPSSPVSGGAAELMKDDKTLADGRPRRISPTHASADLTRLTTRMSANYGWPARSRSARRGAKRQRRFPVGRNGVCGRALCRRDPNELFALDAATGDLKWKYSPRVDPRSQGVACCDVVNRGEVYDNGKIFYNTLDNHTVAVDAKTGKEVWAVKLGEITRARPSPWRRSPRRAKSLSAIPAARWAFAAG